MRLLELELTNIKSYQHEIIKFNDGINCILGLNGSGKSTIIESIGSVLFNYNQRTNNNLLRYNETKGMISLLFEGNDNKLYKIIKTIKTKGGSIKIIDFENNQVLQESVSDVYEFVKKTLSIPKEKNLPKMFEEIIAVPQGTFVNAFLETPKNRKENFDKLFELDIYKDLADKVKVLNDKLEKEYIFELEKEISEINGKLVNFDNVKKEHNNLEQALTKDIELYNVNFDIYNKKKEQKEQLELKEKELFELQEVKNNSENKISILNSEISSNNELLEKTKKAKNIIKENEFGYQLYLRTNTILQKNEFNYDIYLNYSDKIKNNEKEISNYNSINEKLKENIHDLKVELGILKQQVIDKNQEIIDKQKEIELISSQLQPLRQQINSLIQQKEQDLLNYKLNLESLYSVNEYLLLFDKSSLNVDFSNKIQTINNELDKISINKNKLFELEKEKVKLDSDLENLQTNHIYIKDGLCPILKQKCLNIKGSDLTGEVNKLIEEKLNKLQKINENINQLISENSNEEQLTKEKELIEIEQGNHQKNYEKYYQIIDSLKKKFEEIKDINETNDLDIVSSLIKKYQLLIDEYQNKTLEQLKKKEEKFNNSIYSNQSFLVLSKNYLDEANKKEKNLVDNISKKETELYINDEKLFNLSKDNEEIFNKIKDFSNLKEIIDDNKKVLDKHKENYELYISNNKDALEFDKYNNIVIQKTKELDIYKEQVLNISNQIEKLSEGYSKQLLENINKEILSLTDYLSALNATIKLNKENKEKLDIEIANFSLLLDTKNKLEININNYKQLYDKLKIVRDVYNNLPRELSKQIRKYISTFASSLYRKISLENVRIDILDDYEIILIDCIDESKIKHLSQLSGGEQMSVSIAIRLAMLKQITNVDFYFMDEPTINLDKDRRTMICDVVKDISYELKQMFIISHDDTFENITDNIIQLSKINNISNKA